MKTQGKHKEFYLSSNVATLYKLNALWFGTAWIEDFQ